MKQVFFMAALFFPLSAWAVEESQTVASPKCDASKIQKIGGNAVHSVTKAEWEGGYYVSLDTAKLSAVELNKKLMDAGCF